MEHWKFISKCQSSLSVPFVFYLWSTRFGCGTEFLIAPSISNGPHWIGWLIFSSKNEWMKKIYITSNKSLYHVLLFNRANHSMMLHEIRWLTIQKYPPHRLTFLLAKSIYFPSMVTRLSSMEDKIGRVESSESQCRSQTLTSKVLDVTSFESMTTLQRSISNEFSPILIIDFQTIS